MTALCPSIEESNDFVQLLKDPIFEQYDKLYIFLVKYKYDHHAELLLDNIKSYGKSIPKVEFVVIDADLGISDIRERHTVKMEQIIDELNKLNL